jgi:hypothetical protein
MQQRAAERERIKNEREERRRKIEDEKLVSRYVAFSVTLSVQYANFYVRIPV